MSETTYTFDEFVQYGRDNGANIVDDMPWSFNFLGHPVTHENNDLYLIAGNEPNVYPYLRFKRGEVLKVNSTHTDEGVKVTITIWQE